MGRLQPQAPITMLMDGHVYINNRVFTGKAPIHGSHNGLAIGIFARSRQAAERTSLLWSRKKPLQDLLKKD